jgi:hypothetical protein
MDMSKHTATPWRTECWLNHAPRAIVVDDASIIGGKRVVATCGRDEDAAFIVRACNAHRALVAAAHKALAECVDLLATPAGNALEAALSVAGAA